MKKRDGDVTVAAVLTHHVLAAILFDRAALRILRPSTDRAGNRKNQQLWIGAMACEAAPPAVAQ